MNPLPDLISRLQTATGPDRELDARIWAEINDRDVITLSSDTWRDALFGKSRLAPHDECFLHQSGHTADEIPRYTGSLDDALTLVPPGWFPAELRFPPNPNHKFYFIIYPPTGHRAWDTGGIHAGARTAALAVTRGALEAIASLKAIAAKTSGEAEPP